MAVMSYSILRLSRFSMAICVAINQTTDQAAAVDVDIEYGD